MLFEYTDGEFFFIRRTDDDKMEYIINYTEEHIVYIMMIGYEYVESNTYNLLEDDECFDTNFLTNTIQEIEDNLLD